MKIRFAVLTALLVWTASLQASFDAFLQIDGIQGEATSAGFENTIDIYSYSWGMSNPTTTVGGATGKVVINDFHFTKRLDKASPVLMLHCATGEHIPQVSFVFRKAGVDRNVVYYRVTFQDVLVSSFQIGGSSGEDRPMESLSFNFAKVKVDYFQQDATGGTGAPVTFGWDLATGKGL